MALAAPVQTAEERLDDRVKRGILMASLRRFKKMSELGEADRRAADKKGIKLARDLMWESGITVGRLPITANLGASIIQEFVDRITKNRPVFEIEPIVGENDDAARLLEGALLTVWDNTKMQETLKSAAQLEAFTRPTLLYEFWDTNARNGVGDLATRIIPAHRSIIDQRHIFIRDMEFCGVREVMSRAKLIELFPDKHREIMDAAEWTGANDNVKPGATDDPLKTGNKTGQPGQLSRLVANNQNQFTGKTTVKVGGRNAPDPLAQQVEVEFLWFIDDTPVSRLKPKLNSRGKPVYRHMRDDNGRIRFKRNGYRTIQSHRGPRYLPNLEPHREPEMETVVEKLYPHRRHIAWVPQDGISLWDVRWDGPIPLQTIRTSVPIYEYWNTGVGQRVMSLSIARNILWTIIFQRLKLSMSGTFLATPQSGLRRNKLTPEDGQVFYAKKIDADNVRQFPVTPLDVQYVQVLHEMEAEMQKLVGVTPTMQGKSQGRVDTGQAYDSLIEQAGTRVVEGAQLLEEAIKDWAKVGMWYYQNYATHEHFVEVEEDDGETRWRRAMALALKGEFAVKVDVVSDMIHSAEAMRERIKEGAALGLYPIPMLAKLGKYPQWRRGLRMRAAIQKDPSKAWMLGVAGAAPGKAGQLPQASSGKRSHHGPSERKTPSAATG